EALELGMAEIEGLVLSGPLVSGPKGLGSGPGLERSPALPYGVGGIERVIFGFRTFEQAEFHKPRHRVEVAITGQPYVFESVLRPFDDAESVHGDKHRGISWLRAKSSAMARCQSTLERAWVYIGCLTKQPRQGSCIPDVPQPRPGRVVAAQA